MALSAVPMSLRTVLAPGRPDGGAAPLPPRWPGVGGRGRETAGGNKAGRSRADMRLV